MGNLKNKLTRLMIGRYGIDQLYYALLGVWFVLLIANTFIRSGIISILMGAVLAGMIFRTLSRNIYKRRQENDKFMKMWNRIKAEGSLTMRRIREIKTHRFRKCPHCKRVLRLPRRKGKHTVKCPCCHHEFELCIRL
jgi:hypothetical protein